MATSFEYSNQARTYDLTRAASPSVLAPLRAALGDRPGSLVDVGGGTGNYARALADEGWRPVVLDRNAGMLGRAASKQLPVALGDASALPVADGSVDAVVFVSMLHHVPDWQAALAEARRVVRPGGVVAVMAFTREQVDVHWVLGYLPATLAHFAGLHQTRDELLGALPGAVEHPVLYEDVVDGSVAALCRRPELLLDPEVRAQTSLFEWAETHTPDELADGMARLEADLAAGVRPQDADPGRRAALGDASVLAWRRPT
ncbi:methyltransferase domain-containing protein [Iamia majanohamensis]|uniref:Methyltransferase domain-containing protein n=1 Tax=Iamia majanohamensis TaxID=467976 RepID=A0AAE9Y761_9ACTN|nr:methyltransferase domain-containing protein [Iamia majanohamensis]WCO65549.1 methyltransferase domain-containing protein [Iamia majanohamensis]